MCYTTFVEGGVEMIRLPDSELDVMKAVWKCSSPMKRSDIEAVLFKEKPMAVTTLLTLLTRLNEKGFIEIRKEGRHSLYIPVVDEHEYQTSLSRNFIERVFNGNLSAFASALSDGGLSKEEVEELRELLRSDRL